MEYRQILSMTVSEAQVRETLIESLKQHQRNDTLPDQTPRMLREQVAKILEVSDQSQIDEFKDKIKVWISGFLQEPPESPPKKKKTKNTKKRTTASSCDEFSTSQNSANEGDSSAVSPSGLRSIAKMVGVPPSFWSGIDRNSTSDLSARLIEFCDTKAVVRSGGSGTVPTVKEAKAFQRARETAAELEGINQSNIVSGKRRRNFGLPF